MRKIGSWRVFVYVLLGIAVVGVTVAALSILTLEEPEWLEPSGEFVIAVHFVVGLAALVGTPYILYRRYEFVAPAGIFLLLLAFSGTNGELPGWLLVLSLWPIGLLLYVLAASVEVGGRFISRGTREEQSND